MDDAFHILLSFTPNYHVFKYTDTPYTPSTAVRDGADTERSRRKSCQEGTRDPRTDVPCRAFRDHNRVLPALSLQGSRERKRPLPLREGAHPLRSSCGAPVHVTTVSS